MLAPKYARCSNRWSVYPVGTEHLLGSDWRMLIQGCEVKSLCLACDRYPAQTFYVILWLILPSHVSEAMTLRCCQFLGRVFYSRDEPFRYLTVDFIHGRPKGLNIKGVNQTDVRTPLKKEMGPTCGTVFYRRWWTHHHALALCATSTGTFPA